MDWDEVLGVAERNVDDRTGLISGTNLTLAEFKAILDSRLEDRFWCSCAEPGDGYYVPDGMNPACHKHHWRCQKCGKVIQVG